VAISPYPVPPRADVVDEHHGEAVPDPFRPLEDPDSPATVRWVEEEQALTESTLASVPGRAAVRDRVAQLWDYPKVGTPMRRGGLWFQLRNSGLQPQPVLYVGEAPAAAGRALIDPNDMAPDGTVAMSGLSVSADGALAAYALSESGSDWMTWRVRDVATGEDLPDEIRWSKFSYAAWAPDRSGFWYGGAGQPPPGEEFTAEIRLIKLRFHRLGSPQADDSIVFEAPDETDWIPAAEVTDDGRYLVITVARGTGQETFLLAQDLLAQDSEIVALNRPFEAQDHVVVGLPDGGLIIHTDRDAERGRLVRANLSQKPDEWVEIVPHTDDTLLGAAFCGGHLVCHYLHDAHSLLRLHSPSGAFLYDVPLPGIVSVVPGPSGAVVEGRPDSSLVHYQVVSFTEPGAVWSLDIDTGATSEVFRSESAFDGSRFLTEQVFVDSDDGTRVPLFVTRPIGSAPDGSARVLLYAYGGFNIPMTPTFSVTFAAWLDLGGMLGVACLRGGGEYGRDWHDAGRLANKQKVFDDFAACARWLAASGWSRPSRIAINGGSNGGLLVGATLTQHPELFGAAVADVGVFDMLRFHKFTIGWAWKSDYGDPEDPEQYRWLRAYSPLHNVRAGTCYPPTMLLIGDHDDRVVPSHSLKFAATLQSAQGCEQPILLRVALSAGHGAGKPTGKLIDEAADRLTFLQLALGPS
jgi:prolyl oligopeptidase